MDKVTHGVDVAAQYQNQKIREVVPAPRGTIIPKKAAALTLVPAKLLASHGRAVAASAEAYSRCVANLSLEVPQAERDKGYAALRDAQDKAVESSADVERWLNENLERLLAEHAAAIPGEVTDALALIEQATSIAETISARTQALARARNSDNRKRWTPLAALKLAGGDSLHNARAGFEALLPKEPLTLIPRTEYHERAAAGEDMSRFKITQSPGGLHPVGRPEWE